jgi:hypothetical protein
MLEDESWLPPRQSHQLKIKEISSEQSSNIPTHILKNSAPLGFVEKLPLAFSALLRTIPVLAGIQFKGFPSPTSRDPSAPSRAISARIWEMELLTHQEGRFGALHDRLVNWDQGQFPPPLFYKSRKTWLSIPLPPP